MTYTVSSGTLNSTIPYQLARVGISLFLQISVVPILWRLFTSYVTEGNFKGYVTFGTCQFRYIQFWYMGFRCSQLWYIKCQFRYMSRSVHSATMTDIPSCCVLDSRHSQADLLGLRQRKESTRSPYGDSLLSPLFVSVFTLLFLLLDL